MKNIEFLGKEIQIDIENIQEMINLIPLCKSKGEKRSLEAVIKLSVKNVHNQKCLIDEKMFNSRDKVQIPLFEVEPSQLTILEEYQDMGSFFSNID